MYFDFYLQGTSKNKDGEIMLCLSEDELRVVVEHNFRKTRVVRNLVERAVSSLTEPRAGILTPLQLSGFLPELQEEREGMNERVVYPNSKRNPQIQIDFYLNQIYSILGGYAEKALAEERNWLIVPDTFEVWPEHIVSPPFIREPTVSMGAASIVGATITHADVRYRRFEGTVSFLDHIERSGGDDGWIAKPIPERAKIGTRGEKYKDLPFYVREKDINILTNGYHFTLIEGLNRAMRDYVVDTIREFSEEVNRQSA